jgi:outer membrane protein OmpA-like peptidoglycan-associated protein
VKTPLFNIIGLMVAVSALSACETVDNMFKSNDDVVVINGATGQVVEPKPYMSSMPTAPAPAPTNVAPVPAPGQPYAGNFDPNNLMSVYNQISRGGVQMYDPSQGGDMSGYGGGLSSAGGVPSPQDSRVTVFPLEGGYMGDMGQAGMASPYVSTAYAPSGAAGYLPGSTQIFFKHGSSRLGSGDEQKLEQVAEQAKFSPVDRISIEGHASTRAATGDPVTDRAVNLKQSMDRTYAVSRSLMLKGVPAEKIKATSWGDTRQPEGISEDQARRVDIYTGTAP